MELYEYMKLFLALIITLSLQEILCFGATTIGSKTVNSSIKYTSLNTTTETNDLACMLLPNAQAVCDEIANLANAEYKLVKLTMTIDGTNKTRRNMYSEEMYEPTHWVIATSATGRSMLMLREYFEPMSFHTLSYGVANLKLTLEQHPANCLDNMRTDDIETLFRDSLLNNFGWEIKLPGSAEVCNRHVISDREGEAYLVYICCKHDLNTPGAVLCHENKETIWIELLFISLFCIQAFIVAFCPLILPDSFFKAKTIFENYFFKTDSGKCYVLNVKPIDSKTTVNDNFVKTTRHTFTHLTVFKQYLERMNVGTIYTLYVNGVKIAVRGSKLVANGTAPVGVVNFIYQFFIRCALRIEIESVSACCNAKLFKAISQKINFRWYQCLRIFMLILCACVLFSPWIIRVWFYYTYEHEVMEHQVGIHKDLRRKMPFGFMVSYFSPFHPLFMTIYVLLGLGVIFYIPQPNYVKRKLKFTIRKCFRDMRSGSRLDACGYFISKLFYPLTRFGIVGCLFTPIWAVLLPFLILLLAIDALPIVNLTLRLLANLVYYILRLISPQTFTFVPKHENGRLKRWINKRLAAILVTDFQEQSTRLNQLVHVSSLIMSLVAIWFILFLAVDFLAFVVECIVYGLIGFILYPRDTMKYFSLSLLIIVYGLDCFSGVKGRYAAYGSAINSKVQEMIGEKFKEVASQSAKDQINTAFRIEQEEDAEQMYLVAGSEGYLKWRAPRLVLFLDSLDTLYIPCSLLMRMGRLSHAMCPGRVHMLYLKALLDFSLIVLFLLFVFIVVFAFGQAQDISSGGQAIAALGSGFLPLILKKFLFQSQGGPSVDSSNMSWHFMFKNEVENYKERWNFEDFQILYMEEATPEQLKDKDESTLTTDINDSEITDENTATNINAIELLPLNKGQNIEIDLIVKTVELDTGDEDLEFYVPKNRVADYEGDEQIEVTNGQDDVV
ncbi:hypothetical protein ACF0H5_013172 [Mactra antiquata]